MDSRNPPSSACLSLPSCSHIQIQLGILAVFYPIVACSIFVTNVAIPAGIPTSLRLCTTYSEKRKPKPQAPALGKVVATDNNPAAGLNHDLFDHLLVKVCGLHYSRNCVSSDLNNPISFPYVPIRHTD